MTLGPVITPQQVEELKMRLAQIPSIRQEIDRAKRAGLDMTSQEAELKLLETQLTALINAYDTTKPSTRR